MKRNSLIFINLLGSLAATNLVSAQTPDLASALDGKKVYTQMCASCHGRNGEGVGNGLFPPLKESNWLKGEPDASKRIAKILLHGLTGPIEVNEKPYNLVMPAQGALSDEQKVAVIKYIKQEFAGEKTNFSIKDLQAIKKKSGNRMEAWTAKELLKQHPLPKVVSPISNLIMTVYHGKWDKLPDFSKLEAVAEEEEHDGFLSLKNIKRKDHFGLVWKGDLAVPEDGTYEFALLSDDGSALYINGKEVASIRGIGGATNDRIARGKVTLKKGSHKIKVEYFENNGNESIALTWRNLKSKKQEWLSERKKSRQRAPVVIDLSPTDGNTKMYNNFIAGSTHRTMGVGYPHGHNIAFSLQYCQPDMIWKGKFISAGRHWTGRGQGAQAPFSNEVIKLGKGSPWSQSGKVLKVQLKGYKMDKTGNPTFRYVAAEHGLVFTEKYLPSKDSLKRVITVTTQADQKLTIRLAKGNPTFSPKGAIINDLLIINAKQAQVKNDILSTDFDIKKGSNTFTIHYSWKK